MTSSGLAARTALRRLLRPSSLHRYTVVGLLNTALGLAVIYTAKVFTDDFNANLIGYLLVVPVSFMTHRNLSFRDRGPRLAAFRRFIGSVLFGYLCNIAVLRLALTVSIPGHIAQALAIATYVAVVYLLSRWQVFRHPT